MADQIDYYLSLNSPWSYMGHDRFVVLAERNGLEVRIHPVDFAGVIFPATGGLPVGKRSPQRQAYRLVDLARWSEYLDIPLNIHPRFWPANEVLAAHSVLVARDAGADAVRFAGALMRAVWAEDRDIGDHETLMAVADGCGLDAEGVVAAAQAEGMAELRASESRQAIERGVFGAPTYIYKEQPFWGQDRLELLKHVVEA